MNLIKLSMYAIGGAVGLSAAAAFGGVGVVAGGAAAGLTALEVAIIGGGAGTTVYKIKHDQANAKRATKAAADKIAAARKVLDDLEA
jgi:hypothetical protein